MKTIVITMEVSDDTDILNVHEELLEQHGLTSNVCVYESEAAHYADYIESGRQWSDVMGR